MKVMIYKSGKVEGVGTWWGKDGKVNFKTSYINGIEVK